MLTYRLDHLNTLVRRNELLPAVWSDDDYFMGRGLDVSIARFRKRIAPNATLRIENVHGVGFILKQ